MKPHAPHLLGYHVARERYDADVVAGRSLDGYDVAPLQIEPVDVLVVGPARILEPHLEDVGGQVVGVALGPLRFVEFEASLYGNHLRFGFGFAEAASAAHVGPVTGIVSFGRIHFVKFS